MTRLRSVLVALVSAIVLLSLAAPVLAGPGPGPEDIVLPRQDLSASGDPLEGLEAIDTDDTPLADEEPTALDRLGELLGAAGGAIADAVTATVGAIGSALAWTGSTLWTGVKAVGSGIQWAAVQTGTGVAFLATGLWSGLGFVAAKTGHGLVAGAQGIAWLATGAWSAIGFLAVHTWTGIAATATFLAGLTVDAGRGLVSLWPDDPKTQAIVAGSTAGAAAAGGAVWYTKAWKVLRFLPFLAPLYTRIDRGELLDHPVRAGLYAAIQTAPGTHISELARTEELSWGTLLHHLEKLEKGGLIVSTSTAGKRCFFLSGQVPSEQRTILPALENDKAHAIAAFFAEHPGSSQKDAADGLGLSAALVSWHVKRLEEAGVLRRERVGRTQRVDVTGEAMPVLAGAAA